jgi:hypothetical protein
MADNDIIFILTFMKIRQMIHEMDRHTIPYIILSLSNNVGEKCNNINLHNTECGEFKGIVRPTKKGHESPEGKQSCSSTLSSTLALDGVSV